MKKLFVSYKLALLAKEKGFDEPCFAYYQQFNIPTPTFHFGIIQHHQNENYKGNNWNKIDKDFQLTDYINNNFVSVPLYQQLIDWFREKHNIEIQHGCKIPIEAVKAAQGKLDHLAQKYIFYIYQDSANPRIGKGIRSDNYYEALNKALEEAFKLI